MGERGPTVAPLEVERGEERWRHFDNSVNAVSFGFVATAILVSMFLVMAIFEHFLRPRPSPSSLLPTARGGGGGGGFLRRRRRSSADLEDQRRSVAGKLDSHSPKMPVYAKGVSVLMPGHSIPTFIAHPAPAPCPPERISWPPHYPIPLNSPTSNSS